MSTEEVVTKARELGAQLAGVASAEALADLGHPPGAVLNGARSVVVLARRFVYGGVLQRSSRARSHHYATELGLTELEETALRLMFWLEDRGHPALMVPASASRSKQEDLAADGPLSLTHAGVEAGLGTLGLNGMLLTPEYGPRVILSAVVTLAPLQPSVRHEDALCLGEACGRCLLACPGSAIGQWDLDVEACRPHSAPYDYPAFQRHLERVLTEPDPDEQWKTATSTDSLMFWQSMLRGVGIQTGCTRCQDVCPVGEDYPERLAQVLDDIPEATPAKRAELQGIQGRAAAGEHGPGLDQRWHGHLPDADGSQG
ncbi:MAG: hypothetical protein ACRDOH_13255 [Streptosporangiaceae bacterium]